MSNAAVSPGRRAALIAVVEDDAAVLDALVLLMETLGYRTAGGQDPEQVVRRLAGRCPDLIVADYRLRAGLTGFEAISRISEQAGDWIPAIMVTGDTSASWQAEALRRRLPVLQKPVIPRRLVAAIERALG